MKDKEDLVLAPNTKDVKSCKKAGICPICKHPIVHVYSDARIQIIQELSGACEECISEMIAEREGV